MSRSQAGIRRDAAAARQFTQIANALFRDPRVSLRAKGIFGYVSTHRSGWQVTIDDLMRRGPDGRDAVRAALWELEAHGYLIRERLRRPDGTLAKIVYCITDRPATVDLALIEAGLGSMAFDTEPGCGGGAGIRRGVMAADQFTQIANALFRDARLSFKAKGLYGLLSTHRDGWRMTVTALARRSREGESAVKSGLKELEKHGFLARERERSPGGTLGPVTYRITELPALQSPRSQPESGFPPVGEPTLADWPTRTPTERTPLSRTPAPSVRASAATPRTPPAGHQARMRPHPCRRRTNSIPASACCWRSQQAILNSC
ncbi:helix-turn-helix domain-containing protein [Streptomyces sp. NPDC054837]